MAWDVSRRVVLGAGALGATAAGLATALSGAASARNRRLTLVEETSVPESRQFAGAIAEAGWGESILRVDRTLNALLHALEQPTGLIVGLTSDPAAMIAGQLLGERGARERLVWQHHYVGGRWRHSVESAPRLLEAASLAWPVAVAHHFRDTIANNFGANKAAGARGICDSNSCALAPSSPGMLVSWAYEIEGNTL